MAEIPRIGVIGSDEISLKKGHRDFATTETALTDGKNSDIGSSQRPQKENSEEISEKHSEKTEEKNRRCVFGHV